MKIAHRDGKGFASCRWIVAGFGCVAVASVGHVVVLPFADMTLLATSCSTAIVWSAMLSIVLLGERLQWIYDLPAALFICIGTTLTVLQMHHKDEEAYDRQKVREIFSSYSALALISVTFFMVIFACKSYSDLKF